MEVCVVEKKKEGGKKKKSRRRRRSRVGEKVVGDAYRLAENTRAQKEHAYSH